MSTYFLAWFCFHCSTHIYFGSWQFLKDLFHMLLLVIYLVQIQDILYSAVYLNLLKSNAWYKSNLVWNTYSEISIKRPVLLNDLVWIFPKRLIKRPGPSQFYVEFQKNVLFLLNDLVFFKKVSIKRTGLYLTTCSNFLKNLY